MVDVLATFDFECLAVRQDEPSLDRQVDLVDEPPDGRIRVTIASEHEVGPGDHIRGSGVSHRRLV
jgi:hypothetical protein